MDLEGVNNWRDFASICWPLFTANDLKIKFPTKMEDVLQMWGNQGKNNPFVGYFGGSTTRRYSLPTEWIFQVGRIILWTYYWRRFENQSKQLQHSNIPKEIRDNRVIPIFLFTHLSPEDIRGKMTDIGFEIWQTIPNNFFEIQIWKTSVDGKIKKVVGIVHLR
jgi:hypothetical protein